MDKKGSNNPGNFANDRQKASDAGRKGGQASSGGNLDRSRQQEQPKRGGGGQGKGTDRTPGGRS